MIDKSAKKRTDQQKIIDFQEKTPMAYRSSEKTRQKKMPNARR
jgi:hypothetical protein